MDMSAFVEFGGNLHDPHPGWDVIVGRQEVVLGTGRRSRDACFPCLTLRMKVQASLLRERGCGRAGASTSESAQRHFADCFTALPITRKPVRANMSAIEQPPYDYCFGSDADASRWCNRSILATSTEECLRIHGSARLSYQLPSVHA